jgi:hypothetical protein
VEFLLIPEKTGHWNVRKLKKKTMRMSISSKVG